MFVNDGKAEKVVCAEKVRGRERLATFLNSVFVFYAQLYISQFSPPGYCGAFARLVSPWGGALANFALPRGLGFANPGATLELLEDVSIDNQYEF